MYSQTSLVCKNVDNWIITYWKTELNLCEWLQTQDLSLPMASHISQDQNKDNQKLNIHIIRQTNNKTTLKYMFLEFKICDAWSMKFCYVINQCKKPWTWRTPINFILRVIYIYDDKYSNHGFHNFSNLNLVSNYKINGDFIIIFPTQFPPLFPIPFLSI